jgi:NAD(P)-dependent dehydrogenase (short-subunit alcohol dehydrogenase family)
MNILITGVSKGIGNALLNYFLNLQDVNLVFAVSTNANIGIDHPKLKLIHSDFAKEDFLSPVKIAVGDLPIHILINNSGYLKHLPFNEITPQEFNITMDINFKAPFFLVQLLLPNLILAKAHIVNIGSMGGFQGSSKFSGLSIYSASKAALANLTECLANELSTFGIKVNCFALGAVNTEMLRNAFPNYQCSTQPNQVAKIIADFSLNWGGCVSGQIIPLTFSNPS